MVILDQSGSMSGRAMDESAKACRMIVRAIERCGGLVSVAGFFENGSAVDLRVVKPFGKRAIACAKRCNSLRATTYVRLLVGCRVFGVCDLRIIGEWDIRIIVGP
jgi:cobalamin biosynthesis protein CobT